MTVRRGDRPKKLRTYSLRRIRRRVWLSSRVYERFASPKEHGFCEHESGSLEMVEHFEKVRLVLAAVTDEKHEFLEITKAVPLVADLLSVDQVLTTFEQDACKAVLLVALSNAINWTGDRGADVFTLPFRRFVDGPDVVIVSAHGDTARLAELLTRFLSTMRELGETQVYLTNTVSTVVGDAGKRCIAYEGWRVVPSDSRGLIRCVRS